MYLHIGNDIVIPFKEIIAILNLSTTKRSTINSEFLRTANTRASSRKRKGTSPFQDNKSCIITEKDIFYSSISSGTLVKRSASLLRNLEEE